MASLDASIRRAVKMSFDANDIPGGFLDGCVNTIQTIEEILAAEA